MRQIILDTETTGLEPSQGHRIIELAGIEVLSRHMTGDRFHRYLNPGRNSDDAAKQVHGIEDEFLLDKPKFTEIAKEFIDYVSGAELIIHNAPFDLAFLNNELGLAGFETVHYYVAGVTDTLVVAKELHPGKRNNLNALCDRYQIGHSKRTLHGALLDAELLGEVYLAMTRGQESLIMDLDAAPLRQAGGDEVLRQYNLVVQYASDEELFEHEKVLANIGKESKRNALWLALATG
ncbi:MAG: DNA polymerase III subunit epsilon [Pseudomonadota bacterium]|nr:DNA polymerase III subunit epsilon [Pseudomonadota bacterium]